MVLHTKSGQDRLLAPVAVEIDTNLQHLRSKPVRELMVDMELELDRRVVTDDPGQRREAIVDVAVRDVDLRGCEASISDDGTRLHLVGSTQSLDLGLSEAMIQYLHGSG